MATLLQCPECGRQIEVEVGVRAMMCESCGAVVIGDSALNRAIADAGDQLTPQPNPTPVRPGMKCRFLGRNYEVRGRVVLAVKEEGVDYSWHEFQLQAADGEIAYLEYDDGKWKWMKPFLPRFPIDPQKAKRLQPGALFKLEDKSVAVKQNDTARVLFSEGPLTFNVDEGDRFSYIDAGSGAHLYSVQWNADEIEFFRGQEVAEREVLEAFGLHQALAQHDRQIVGSRSQGIFATVCLVCSLWALVMWMGSGPQTGTLIANGSQAIGAIGPEGVRFGPFNLDPSQRVHALIVHGSMTQSSAWVQGVMETADGIELLESQGDFWDESGYDDEAWHEWNLSSHSYFLAREKTPYYLRLYAERDSPGGAYNNAGYEIRSGVRYPGHLGTFSFFSGALALLFACLSQKKQLKQMSQSLDSDD